MAVKELEPTHRTVTEIITLFQVSRDAGSRACSESQVCTELCQSECGGALFMDA